MKLRKVNKLEVDYKNKKHDIRVDENDYFCLTDMAKNYPNKRLDKWLCRKSTIGLVQLLASTFLGKPVIIVKKGGPNQGTYAREELACAFGIYLDPLFKVRVLITYRQQDSFIGSWNRTRIASSLANRLMTDAVKNFRDQPKPHHYSNETQMINRLVFGFHKKDIRDEATEEQLMLLSKLMSYNAALIELGIGYKDRKQLLTVLTQPKANNK